MHLQKFLLYNSPDLGKEISHYVNILEACSYLDMTARGWKYDPPKVISDLTESVFGAMFIDSGCDYAQLKTTVLRIFNDLLKVITPDLPRDPVAELLTWVTRNGCRKCRFK
jgi:endoribonuclease Dicer